MLMYHKIDFEQGKYKQKSPKNHVPLPRPFEEREKVQQLVREASLAYRVISLKIWHTFSCNVV